MPEVNVTTVEISEYKGKPVISLPTPGKPKFPVTFGLGKAKVILENLEAIRAFVASDGTRIDEIPF